MAVLPNHRLNWSAHIAGKRESRRLLGDVILTSGRHSGASAVPDGFVPTGWSVDLHLPDPRYEKGFEGDAFIARAHSTRYPLPYWVPYRCLYSRNIANLFMAGRVHQRDARGARHARHAHRRLMGEVVGMAAAVCRQHDGDPRDVYHHHWEDLRSRMLQGVGKPPDVSKWLSPPEWLATLGENLALEAEIRVSGHLRADTNQAALLNDGRVDVWDNEERWLSHALVPNWIELSWPEPRKIAAVRVVSGYHQGTGIVQPIAGFVWQYQQDGQWCAIPGAAATQNDAVDWSVRFPEINSRRLRLLITATHIDISRIWEIEVLGSK
jgi:hypothetical protein